MVAGVFRFYVLAGGLSALPDGQVTWLSISILMRCAILGFLFAWPRG
jgi:hypothetical protein